VAARGIPGNNSGDTIFDSFSFGTAVGKRKRGLFLVIGLADPLGRLGADADEPLGRNARLACGLLDGPDDLRGQAFVLGGQGRAGAES
jgi:hypothetical protein